MLKKIKCTLWLMSIVLFIAPSYVHSAVNPDFTPQWQVGDSWNMATRQMEGYIPGIAGYENYTGRSGERINIHFEVLDLKEIDGEMCHVVEVTKENNRGTVHLYVREDDFTLKELLKGYIDEDGRRNMRNYYDNDHDFIIFIDSFRISIPFDFPNFPATNTDEERTATSPEFGLMNQKVTFLDENTVKIELSTDNNSGVLKTVQIWEKGKPWWSSVRRTQTYKDYKTGEMKTHEENNNVLEDTDTTSPELSVSVSPATLWPPNHKMIEITPTINVSDDYDQYPEVKLDSAESDEPDDAPGRGDGRTTEDIKITEDGRLFLRAERDGKGYGRTYTITYTATDFSGNVTSEIVDVTVPHDRRK